ncbi:related to SLD5 - subunit of the GINS complex [Ustilago sp. UG-2017a]|nr:related to SLD5 - subunit of the GINS complex [Ustilago sp. UG-2017a]
MPLPRYSLDDGAEEDEEFEESYASHQANGASSSRHPHSSLANAGSSSRLDSATPSITGGGRRRSASPASSSLNAAPAPAPASSLDIDALLSTTTGASHSHSEYPGPSSSSSSSNGWPYSSSSPIARLKPFEQLTLFMATQKASPELLPFPTSAFESLVGQMEQQQSILDNLLHLSSHPSADPGAEGGVDEDEFLRLNLVQVDLERCKWLLKQIVRSRMDLLQKYAGFIGSRIGEKMKCNAAEQRFADEYWSLKKDHFSASVLSFLPEQLHEFDTGAQQQQDTFSQQDSQQQASNNMLPGPDLDAPVFIRCLQDCGTAPLPDGETATLVAESVHLLRYRSIRHLVYQGSVVLM